MQQNFENSNVKIDCKVDLKDERKVDRRDEVFSDDENLVSFLF